MHANRTKNTKIHIRNNHFHIITQIQFFIERVITHIIHQAQCLTLDYLAFDPSGITKHGLTYITLFQVYF